jgi:hypothetical protein
MAGMGHSSSTKSYKGQRKMISTVRRYIHQVGQIDVVEEFVIYKSHQKPCT